MKPTTVKKTKKVKAPLTTAEEIKKLGTDIGDEKTFTQEDPRPRRIEISEGQETPTWLENLLTILCHTISLTEQVIEGRLVGELGTHLDSKRSIKIIIEDL